MTDNATKATYYLVDGDHLASLRAIADRLLAGSDRERVEGNRLWLQIDWIENRKATDARLKTPIEIIADVKLTHDMAGRPRNSIISRLSREWNTITTQSDSRTEAYGQMYSAIECQRDLRPLLAELPHLPLTTDEEKTILGIIRAAKGREVPPSPRADDDAGQGGVL